MSKEAETLIARLEAATTGGRLLDALIECELRKLQAYEIGMSDKVRSHWNPIGEKGEVICTQGLTRYHAPQYTFSIDAALTLVPKGFGWCLDFMDPYEPDAAVGAHICSRDHGDPDPKKPAIMLCIAALKARTLSHQDHSS